MSVSRRLRYEILRRDGNTCRYCGAKAPDVPLTVDHVVPVALGGSDEPSNLVAACQDCNSGKASSTADSAFVADVVQDALLWRQLTEAAAAQLQAERESVGDFATEFYKALDAAGWRWSIPINVNNTIEGFHRAGVTVQDVAYAADVTVCARGVEYRWAYFCGVIWKHVKKRDELALQMWHEVHGGGE